MVYMDYLLCSMQETNSKEDSVDTVPKLHSWRPSNNCKMWNTREQTLNLTIYVRELDRGRKHKKEVLANRDREAPLHETLYVYYTPH